MNGDLGKVELQFEHAQFSSLFAYHALSGTTSDSPLKQAVITQNKINPESVLSKLELMSNFNLI